MGGSWLGLWLQRDSASIAAQQVMGARQQGLKCLAVAPQALNFKPLWMLKRQGHSGVKCGLKFVSHYGLGIDCLLQ